MRGKLIGALLALSIVGTPPALAKLTGLDPSAVKIDDIVKLPITGMRAVESEGQILFVSESGRFVITGQLHDIWSRTALSTMSQIRDASERLHLRRMGLDVDALNTISLGSGPREVVIFVDPRCSACHTLIEDARALAGDYTFKLVVVPALGDESNRLAKALYCAQDKARALDALVGNALGDLAQRPACDTTGYDQTLLMAHMLSIEGVPIVVAPDGRYSKGRPLDLKSWLEASQ